VSDLLGLGDIVFPAILASWAKETDHRQAILNEEMNEKKRSERKSRFKVRNMIKLKINIYIICSLCSL
jgi:hypothetical protein